MNILTKKYYYLFTRYIQMSFANFLQEKLGAHDTKGVFSQILLISK